MSASLQLPTQTSIKQWLEAAMARLEACGVISARLDAELLLSYELDMNRTYLHTHPEKILDKVTFDKVNINLDKRVNRIPIAYITGKKEFYGREFIVSSATLIPRPESEEVVETLKQLFSTNKICPKSKLKLIDVGAGSGILGITAKLEFPEIYVMLTDISVSALEIAQKNVTKMNVSVDIIQGDLLENYDDEPDIILANLPYVNPEWECSPETIYEPPTALFADDNGTKIIKKLITEASTKLKSGGFVIIESDPCQHYQLSKFAKKHSMRILSRSGYVIVIQKI